MMYQKNGLFFAANTVIVLLLFIVIAPIPVSAQTDSAARVAIQGPEGEFGDVLLVKDGNDIIINGLSGAVLSAGKVTISAEGMTPVTVSSSFLGHFPVKSGDIIRVPNGTTLASATITFVKAGSGATVEGTIPLDITDSSILQALQDYSSEVGKVLSGEKTTIDKGMPPHILLDVVTETPADQPSFGKVLLTQRLVIKQSGNTYSMSLVDQIEGVAGANITPTIQSFPNYSTVGVYGVPVDIDNPDTTKRVHLIDTLSYADGQFVSNGYFFPFSFPNVNSSNVDEIKAGLSEVGISTPQIADILYLHVTVDDGSQKKMYLARVNNDVSAGIQGTLTVLNNNVNNASGENAVAVLNGVADPYAVITAFAENNTQSEWIASATADGSGQFSLSIPPKAEFDEEKGEFGSYLPRTKVFVKVEDPFGNVASSLSEVTTDTEATQTESPIATPQTDGDSIVSGKTEAGALVFIDGSTRHDEVLYYGGVVKADANGVYAYKIHTCFDYKVTIIDLAGNTLVTTILGDQEATQTESPVAVPQANGNMIVSGRTESGATILINGWVKNDSVLYYGGVVVADSSGAYALEVPAYYEYLVKIIDPAGNTLEVTIPGDQFSTAPYNLAASVQFPVIQVSGKADPFASIITYGFNAGVVPENPVATDTLPPGAFYLGGANLENPQTTAKADAEGNFSLSVPVSVGRFIYLQATDPAGNSSLYVPFELLDEGGNPIGEILAEIKITSVQNNLPGLNDIVNGLTVDPETETPISGLVVSAFTGITDDPNVLISFVDQLTEFVPVNDDGSFSLSIPERSPDTNEFITQFYIVAFLMGENGVFIDVGFIKVTESNGFDRVGPKITFAPLSTDFIIRQYGSEEDDYMNINRIYPAGTGAGLADLPTGSIPYVFVLADNNEDSQIDILSSSTYVIDWKPLNSAIAGSPLPIPGVTGLDLGRNYWDPATQSVVGKSVVFIALMDAYGNYSPNPIPVYLDVTIQDPAADKITASGTEINAEEGAVESQAMVSVYEDVNLTGLIATTQAFDGGGFTLTDLSISEDFVYVITRDAAGNKSNAVKVRVNDPIQGTQYYVLDEMGIVHTPVTMLGSAGSMARSLSKVDDSAYVLYADGYITKISGLGEVPGWDSLYWLDNDIARDIEVVSTNPFKAYILLGNGVILTYGDLPFYGDLCNPDVSVARVPMGDDNLLMFLDQNGNGVRDTEDKNGNGVLDISVSVGGVLNTEDTGIEGIDGTADNGILDQETIVNLHLLSQGFGWDIARDLELVKDDDGNVKGYVLMDGYGVLWPFGTDIGAENVKPNSTNGIVTVDIFRDLSLIVDAGKIVDFITLDGYGQLFGLPSDQGGVLGAGASTDNRYAGFLSADQYGLTVFGFDIARDLKFNPMDTNQDGNVDWKDGFYILDGFGGIHAAGGAPEIPDAPFLGLDIARDLAF